MTQRLFLAGASGVVGRYLIPLLLADGWAVTGTTRSADKAARLAALGVAPAIVDVFDAAALRDAVDAAKPAVVVHQLTDLPPGLDPARMSAAREANARIREEGTRNLIAASLAAGAKRLVAQSIAFAYAAGLTPYREEDPIDVGSADKPNVGGLGVASLEKQVLAAPLEGLVLRYGSFYGPGTGFETTTRPGPLHIEDAAEAARLAVRQGPPGIYNIAEDDGTVSIEKAKRLLGWQPAHKARQRTPI